MIYCLEIRKLGLTTRNAVYALHGEEVRGKDVEICISVSDHVAIKHTLLNLRWRWKFFMKYAPHHLRHKIRRNVINLETGIVSFVYIPSFSSL